MRLYILEPEINLGVGGTSVETCRLVEGPWKAAYISKTFHKLASISYISIYLDCNSMTLFHESLRFYCLVLFFCSFGEYLLSILFMKTFIATFYVLSEGRASLFSLLRRDDTKRPLVCFSVLI